MKQKHAGMLYYVALHTNIPLRKQLSRLSPEIIATIGTDAWIVIPYMQDNTCRMREKYKRERQEDGKKGKCLGCDRCS